MINAATTISERRSLRSEVPSEATQLYLSHLALTLGCEAITLSTRDGQLVGAVGEGYDPGLLSALALLGPQIGTYEPEPGHTPESAALRFYGFDVNGSEVFVSCVGGAPLSVDACASALRRIYAAQSPS